MSTLSYDARYYGVTADIEAAGDGTIVMRDIDGDAETRLEKIKEGESGPIG